MFLKEVGRLRQERDELREEIASLRRGGLAPVPAADEADDARPPFDLQAAVAQEMRAMLVALLEEIRTRHVVPRDQVVYVGDGQSDIPVMLHVNRGDGFTIAASEAREVAHIAKRTVISDDALSVLVPVLEEIAGFGPSQIRALFEDHGLVIQEWDRVRTDWLTIRDGAGDGVIRLDLATGT